jgi:hypothetical protein
LEEAQVDRLAMVVAEAEAEHIIGLTIFLLVRVKALVIQLEAAVAEDLDGMTQTYLAELDREAELHGFIALVLFMHLAVMLDRQHMIFTQEQEEAEDLTEVMLAVMELVELAHTQTVAVAAVDLVELGVTAVTAVHQAAITFQAPAGAAVAQEPMEAVMREVYTTEVVEEIIG